MQKFPYGLGMPAIIRAIDAYQQHEAESPETGILEAFVILLAASDIGENLRALEQRAEAAEARANNLNDGWLNAIAERDEARAKLAELEKQEPVAYVMGEETIEDFNSGYEFFAVRDAEHEEEMESIPLFTRPAPATDLAELVPDNDLMRVISFAKFVIKCVRKNGEYAPLSSQEPDEITAILRNIEGAHQNRQQNIPEIIPGWKLVPVEPTERMIIDGFESAPSWFWSTPEEWEAYEAMSGCQQAAYKAQLCWAAMLAAAPEVERWRANRKSVTAASLRISIVMYSLSSYGSRPGRRAAQFCASISSS